MIERWMWRVVLVGVVAAMSIGGAATGVAAATSDDAADAADIIADAMPSKLKASERSCLQNKLSSSDLAPQIVAAGSLDAVDDTTGGAVLGLIANCAPRVLATAITGQDIFKGFDIPAKELRCLAKGFGSLDTATLAAAVGDTEFVNLATDQQDQVVSLMFGCMPTGIGRVLYSELSTDGSKPTARQAKCLGQGFGDVVGEAGGVAVFSGDDPPPEVVGSIMHAMADCTPDALVAVFAKSIRQSGAPKQVATCVAKGIVKDPDMIDVIVEAQSGDGATPPELGALITRCS